MTPEEKLIVNLQAELQHLRTNVLDALRLSRQQLEKDAIIETMNEAHKLLIADLEERLQRQDNAIIEKDAEIERLKAELEMMTEQAIKFRDMALREAAE